MRESLVRGYQTCSEDTIELNDKKSYGTVSIRATYGSKAAGRGEHLEGRDSYL